MSTCAEGALRHVTYMEKFYHNFGAVNLRQYRDIFAILNIVEISRALPATFQRKIAPTAFAAIITAPALREPICYHTHSSNSSPYSRMSSPILSC
jgi:hypothetical protein